MTHEGDECDINQTLGSISDTHYVPLLARRPLAACMKYLSHGRSGVRYSFSPTSSSSPDLHKTILTSSISSPSRPPCQARPPNGFSCQMSASVSVPRCPSRSSRGKTMRSRRQGRMRESETRTWSARTVSGHGRVCPYSLVRWRAGEMRCPPPRGRDRKAGRREPRRIEAVRVGKAGRVVNGFPTIGLYLVPPKPAHGGMGSRCDMAYDMNHTPIRETAGVCLD
ncbi:hypothetical protein EDB81DRAFT_775029, partial [Dactylonectria macrodidyma]